MIGRLRLQVVLSALGLRATLPLLLRALPLDRVLEALTLRAARARPTPDALAAIEQVTDLVTRRFRPLRTACLKRALLRYALLRREGYDPSFVIGVRPGGPDGFEAHAWVAVGDLPIMERQTLDYRPTFVWPRDRALRCDPMGLA